MLSKHSHSLLARVPTSGSVDVCGGVLTFLERMTYQLRADLFHVRFDLLDRGIFLFQARLLEEGTGGLLLWGRSAR